MFLLGIDQIFGASICDNSSFAIKDNVIVYTASGGVVVCTVEESQIKNQRFFCANYISKGPNVSGSSTNNGDYLSAYNYHSYISSSLKTDRFGYPKLLHPINISSSTSSSSSSSNLTNGASTINKGLGLGSNSVGFEDNLGLSGHGSINYGSGNTLGGISITGSSTNGHSSTRMRDKIRTITCVAISSNKKLLAVGESGYQPRILIYSLAEDSNDYPLAYISEHTFGLNCLSFSEDCKYLASLGVSSDAYLNIWKISNNSTTGNFNINLVGSNRCTSIVNNMIWQNDLIYTFGLRHIRVWKFERTEEDVFNKTLNVIKGKNALLGNLLNENFVDGFIVDTMNTAFFLSDTGFFCMLDLSQDTFTVEPVKKFSESISTFYIDVQNDLFWFADDDKNSLKSKKFSNILNSSSKFDLNDQLNCQNKRNSLVGILAGNGAGTGSPTARSSKSGVLTIRAANNSLQDPSLIYVSCNEINLYSIQSKKVAKLIEPVFKHICGLKRGTSNSLIFWSEYGEIAEILVENFRIKNVDTFNLISDESVENKLTAIELTCENELILGDRLGFLFIKDLTNNSYSYYTKAHESAINDITQITVNNYKFVITVSRDRTMQVFVKKIALLEKKINTKENTIEQDTSTGLYNNKSLEEESNWDLLETLTVHKANIIQTITYGNKFYACSADRTISVHKIEFDQDDFPYVVREKLLSVRTTPVKMEITDCENKSKVELVVSTNDKLVSVYNLKTLELQRNLKLYNELNSSLLLENFVILSDLDLILCTCSDKSIRTFSYSTGKLLTINWGHSGLIIGLQLGKDDGSQPDAKNTKNLISISNDGCLFRWKLGSDKEVSNFGDVTLKLEKLSLKSNGPILDEAKLLNSKVQRKVVKSKSVSNMRLHKSQSTTVLKTRPLNIDRGTKSPDAKKSSISVLSNDSHSSRSTSSLSSTRSKVLSSFTSIRGSKSEKRLSPLAADSPTQERPTLSLLERSTPKNGNRAGSVRQKTSTSSIVDDLVNSLRVFRNLHKSDALTDTEMQLVRHELFLTQKLFGDSEETNTNANLLETYSEELIKLVQKKLQV